MRLKILKINDIYLPVVLYGFQITYTFQDKRYTIVKIIIESLRNIFFFHIEGPF